MEILYSTCYKICKAYFIIKSIIDIIRIFGKNSNMSDKSCKNNFTKKKQLKVENTIQSLKEIKDRDLSNKVLKEIKNKLIEISYNRRETVLNTRDNPNNNIKPNLKLNDDELLKQLEDCDTSDNDSNCFLPINNSDYSSSDSESDNDFILNIGRKK